MVDAGQAAAINAELARYHRRVQQRLVDEHRDRLYACVSRRAGAGNCR